MSLALGLAEGSSRPAFWVNLPTTLSFWNCVPFRGTWLLRLIVNVIANFFEKNSIRKKIISLNSGTHFMTNVCKIQGLSKLGEMEFPFYCRNVKVWSVATGLGQSEMWIDFQHESVNKWTFYLLQENLARV